MTATDDLLQKLLSAPVGTPFRYTTDPPPIDPPPALFWGDRRYVPASEVEDARAEMARVGG